MIGLLEGYFVPLYRYHFNPTSVDEKVREKEEVVHVYWMTGLVPCCERRNLCSVVGGVEFHIIPTVS